MARREVVEFIDDIDGKPIGAGGQTVRFSYQGVDYEIDLGTKNAKKFDDALSPYVAAGRRVGGRRVRDGSASAPTDKAQLAAIRDWAREQGYEVSGRGRISREIQEAFQQAH